jgi:glucokinase
LRAAAYSPESNQPLQHARADTHSAGGSVYDRLVALIESIWPKEAVLAIGMASPGPLDPFNGIILAPPNIKEWRNFPLGIRLSEHFGVPVYIDNDGNLAGLAEWKYGSGQGYHNVLYLTISTGIGGGVIISDQLLQGHHGLAAEVGHIMIDPDGPECSCGHAGHVESYVSGPAIARYVNEQLAVGKKSALHADPNLSARQIADAALQGDELSQQAFTRAGEYLGMAVANYLAIFDPAIIIFGGGVTLAGDLLFKPFELSLRKRILHPRYLEGLVITKAALGDDAGLLGALALARLKTSV